MAKAENIDILKHKIEGLEDQLQNKTTQLEHE